MASRERGMVAFFDLLAPRNRGGGPTPPWDRPSWDAVRGTGHASCRPRRPGWRGRRRAATRRAWSQATYSCGSDSFPFLCFDAAKATPSSALASSGFRSSSAINASSRVPSSDSAWSLRDAVLAAQDRVSFVQVAQLGAHSGLPFADRPKLGPHSVLGAHDDTPLRLLRQIHHLRALGVVGRGSSAVNRPLSPRLTHLGQGAPISRVPGTGLNPHSPNCRNNI